jgi:hypothetical protein
MDLVIDKLTKPQVQTEQTSWKFLHPSAEPLDSAPLHTTRVSFIEFAASDLATL